LKFAAVHERGRVGDIDGSREHLVLEGHNDWGAFG
jgi:hypothetical protein